MQTEQVLRTVIDTMIDGVILIDHGGIIQLYNQACQKLFGYTPEEVLGQNVKMLMPTPYREEHDGYVRNYRETGVKRIIGIGREVLGRRKDGSEFPFELAVAEATLDDRPLYIGVIHDITERRRAEEMREQLRQSQKMEAIGQLTGGIAHDFNNLLAVVMGNLELLDMRVSDDFSRRLIDQALHSTTRGAELTQRLLAFGRQQNLRAKRLNANELILSISSVLRHTLGDPVSVRTSLAPGLPEVEVDPGQLENALINLALNARDAMPNGGSLTIRTNYLRPSDEMAHSSEHGYVVISVTDTGSGMSEEVRARVFEPFFTTKEIGKGSGLGLSMVHGFITQSGGHVHVDSVPGRGTEVSLHLPALASLASSAPSENDPGGPTILLVDDNADLRSTVSLLLESMGYRVRAVGSGAAALDILQSDTDVALMITDVMMPGMTGLELGERALRLLPTLPLVFISGTADADILRSSSFRDRCTLLAKPIRKQALGELLTKLLRRS